MLLTVLQKVSYGDTMGLCNAIFLAAGNLSCVSLLSINILQDAIRHRESTLLLFHVKYSEFVNPLLINS